MSNVKILEGFEDFICGKSLFSQLLVYQHKKTGCTGGCYMNIMDAYVTNFIVDFPIYKREKGTKHMPVTYGIYFF